jgi:sugar lactone lactonase YvrE
LEEWHQTQWMLGLAIIAAVATTPVRAQTQAGDPPNPYRTVENWAKLPDGRKWGQTIGVDVDPDGKSIWVFERCGGNTCDGSPVAPILKIDPSGNVVTSFGADMFVFPHGLYVDRDGNVWVTDGRGKGGKGHQVFKFSPTARC